MDRGVNYWDVIYWDWRNIFLFRNVAPKINYAQEQVSQALKLVRKGISVAEAARQTGVARITLLYKKSGKSLEVSSMSPAASLSPIEEEILVDCIKNSLSVSSGLDDPKPFQLPDADGPNWRFFYS